MKAPDALMRPSPTKAMREARGLSRSQMAAERKCTTVEIWLREKLEANLVFRLGVLCLIFELNETEPDMDKVYQLAKEFCSNTPNDHMRR